MKTYRVSLSDETCIFDMRDGFIAIDEAITWARGRGGKYTIMLDVSNADVGDAVIFHYDDFHGFFYSAAEDRYLRPCWLEHYINRYL